MFVFGLNGSHDNRNSEMEEDLNMARRADGVAQLKKIIELAQAALANVQAQAKSGAGSAGRPAAKKSGAAAKKSGGKRVRRSGPELAAFRKMLKAERAKGVSVAELAKKHNVSAVYIYTLK